MMTRQTMIALGAAILLGLFAVYIANAFISRSETKAYQGATTKLLPSTLTTFAYRSSDG